MIPYLPFHIVAELSPYHEVESVIHLMTSLIKPKVKPYLKLLTLDKLGVLRILYHLNHDRYGNSEITIQSVGNTTIISNSDGTRKIQIVEVEVETEFRRRDHFLRIEWLRNDVYHCLTNAARIFIENGEIIEESWYAYGIRHRKDGPALISKVINASGILHVSQEAWYQSGKYHRENGPALTTRYYSGAKRSEIWYIRGKMHRKTGPASIYWYENGNKQSERYVSLCATQPIK